MADASPSELESWIDRMNAGDLLARDQLIQHTYERLQQLTHRMLHDYSRVKRQEEGDDVLHGALLRLLRALESVPPGSVPGFFHLATTQIRRELLDLARHYAGSSRLSAGRIPNETAESADNPAWPATYLSDSTGEPMWLAQWTEFHDQVEALPVHEREVVGLLWYHGMTQAEAAAVLNVSMPTVKRWWSSARQRLRAALHGELPAP
ncbi:MAG: sigma-70 family RNA polymerase sigma factor [Gemmataceae bacterium]|nr:sigma-70 family RNA polymerase sigma factor [Gemmataceae bacterium]